MANLTIKGMDDRLYNDLKDRAKRHHRSIASEATAILERILWASKPTEEEILRRAAASRARFKGPGPGLTMDEIIAAIHEGRRFQ